MADKSKHLYLNLDEIPDLPVIKSGKYKARFVKVSPKLSKSGNRMYVWSFRITEGNYQGTTLLSYTTLLDNVAARSSLKMHLLAIGMQLKRVDAGLDAIREHLRAKVELLVESQTRVSEETGNEYQAFRIAKVSPLGKKKAGEDEFEESGEEEGGEEPEEEEEEKPRKKAKKHKEEEEEEEPGDSDSESEEGDVEEEPEEEEDRPKKKKKKVRHEEEDD